MADDKVILLVEDNRDDEALTLRALKKNNIKNEVIVVHDGAEALDYLFGTGKYVGRNISLMPQLTLLDLRLPKLDGLDVLRRLRTVPAQNSFPWRFSLPRRGSRIGSTVTIWARTAISASPSTSLSLSMPIPLQPSTRQL